MCPGEEPIAAYAAGRLGRAERDAIDAHLDMCSACNELVAVLAKLATKSPPITVGDPSLISPSEPDDLDRLLEGHLGRYVLLSRIGAGGMGVVYSAYDPELDRRVALKLLRRSSTNDALRSEARAIAKLAHPNVVAVHDVGRVDSTSFVAMEFVDGMTLRDWLSHARTPDQILEVFIQAGRGIAAAHAANLVHRDIKPSNIMIGTDGRPRVLDFGLASGTSEAIGGTPAYMAPEQARGEPVDPRSDQFAFCVALWEALGGERPAAALTATGMLLYVPDRVIKALRRGLAPDREARFASMDGLLAELGPAPSRRHLPWLLASIVGLVGGLILMSALHHEPASPCALAGDPVNAVWSSEQRAVVAAGSATSATNQLDDWAQRWRAGAEQSCRATSIDLVQSARANELRQACLAELLEELHAVIMLASHPDAEVAANVDALIANVPAPERCNEVSAVLPPPEKARAEIQTLAAKVAELEAALIVGRTDAARTAIHATSARADALAYLPLQARTQFLEARLASADAKFTAVIPQLHAAARSATAARDNELLAEIWIELVKTLGNVVRSEDADVFDGYVAALIPQLPDRASLTLALEHARCARNVTSANAAELESAVTHCKAAIALAATKPTLVTADLVRVGHFQRMLGHSAEAIATLEFALANAETVFGPDHPDTAITHYALGIALVDDPTTQPRAITELQRALAIRRKAFPAGGMALAESLQGLADALATASRHTEAVPLIEEGLAVLDHMHAARTVTAVNLHILAGMSLIEIDRSADALAHDLAAADIVERDLDHREELGAMALRLAAEIEAGRAQPAVGLADAERALRLLDRETSSPAAIGKTQLAIANLADATHDRARAHAMAVTARTTLLGAGPAGAEDLIAAEAFLKAH